MRPALRAPHSLVVLLLVGSFGPPPAIAGSARAEVERSAIDLGERNRIDGAVGVFEIRNRGDETLRILAAEPSCGCTVVSFDPTIAPGAVGKVEAHLDIATVRGAVWSQIHVRTNDPDRPELLLDLKAQVVGGVRVLPGEDVFLFNRVGQLPSARVLLRKEPAEEGALEVGDLRTSVDWLQARARRLEQARPAGGGIPDGEPGDWILEIVVTGEPTYGRRAEEVRFTTGLSGEPQVMIPLLLDLRPPVQLSEERVVLSPSARSRLVALSVREGIDPTELRVVADPATLGVELEPAGGRFFRLHVSGDESLLGREAAIVFHVGGEKLRLPVEWRAAAEGG